MAKPALVVVHDDPGTGRLEALTRRQPRPGPRELGVRGRHLICGRTA